MDTSHGHHINGTPLVTPRPDGARCGGFGICPVCSTEAAQVQNGIPGYNPDDVEGVKCDCIGPEGCARCRKEAMVTPTETRPEKAKRIVFDYVKPKLEKTDNISFVLEDVYVVQFCYILQNWKALVSTRLTDGMYYEVTYDAQQDQIYLDAYKKWENVLIPS